MKKLLPFFNGYRKETVLAPLFKLMEALMDLLVPLLVAGIINKGIAGNDMKYVTRYFLLMLLLAVLGLAFSFTAQWFSARASVGIASKLRQTLFDHIQSFSCRELDLFGTDTLITRMTSDINQVQTGINMALRLLLRSPFIVFGAMIMAFTIDVPGALIFAVVIPLLAVVVLGIMFFSIPLFKKAQAGLDQVLGITRENLTGVRVIRAFCKEEDEIRLFDEKNQALTRLNEFVGRLSAMMNPATYLLINLAAILLIRQGAIRVSSGALLQGDVVALYNYMAQIVVELVKLASLIITINRAVACANRVQTVLDTEPSMTFPPARRFSGDQETGKPATASGVQEAGSAKSAPFLAFRDVSFSYHKGGDEAVSHISFEAGKGAVIGIIGGTGSGKSTIARLIPRFYDPDAGSVEIDGVSTADYPQGALIDRIGIVPQKAVLFQGTIRENLKWGSENASDEDLWEALRLSQAFEIVDGKPGKLDYRLEQGGRNLSGGQRQRLTIARALVKKPEILILDDSASALDYATDAALRSAIRGLSGTMTVIIISQRASSIRSADLILVLEDGELVGKGDHTSLLSGCRAYQEIYYSQFPDEAKGGFAPGREVHA